MDLTIEKGDVIVFDLDDTLYNEIDFLKSAYEEISLILEPKNNLFLYAQMFSLYRNGKNVFEFIQNKYPITLDQLLAIYRNHLPKITPFDHVESTLAEIKKREGKLAVITDGRSLSQKNKLGQLGLAHFFDYILISEEIGTEKPNELNYLKIQEKLSANRYTYIADNIIKDFVTPNKLGWHTIGIIDNGKNIHFAGELSKIPIEYMPKDWIKNYSELTITD